MGGRMQKKNIFFQHLLPDKEEIEEVG